MRTALLLSFGLCVPLGWTLAAQGADEEARAILRKALKAQGGPKITGKFKATHTKSKGTIHIGAGLEFSGEEFVQFPDHFKSVVEVQVNGMNRTMTTVFTGTKAWSEARGEVMDLEAKLVDEFKEVLHALRINNLTAPLTDKGFKLAPLGEIKVDNQDAVGVRVVYEGRRDANLYFNKADGLLVKTEGPALDMITKQEVTQEKFFSDYKEWDGRKIPGKLSVLNDGKKFMDLEILEFKLVEQYDPSVFARP